MVGFGKVDTGSNKRSGNDNGEGYDGEKGRKET
jgi:hypothetical protein